MAATVRYIILRRVISAETDLYWRHSYDCIRRWTNDDIVIIDSQSDPAFLSAPPLLNTVVVASAYPGRAELLPYIYALLMPSRHTHAVIIHDSVFLREPVPDVAGVATYRFLWHFDRHWDVPADEADLIGKLHVTPELWLNHGNQAWKGCFGGMMVIQTDFLKTLAGRFGLFRLASHVTTKTHRQAFERVIALLCWTLDPSPTSIYGNIMGSNFGMPWAAYAAAPDLHGPAVKVWAGR